ncbi:hypothetical protein HDV00_012052 [Rhizophlyctis rosea]|nr:hypothetical protein HDV00_012052 [Rhizophlyctis rosea]
MQLANGRDAQRAEIQGPADDGNVSDDEPVEKSRAKRQRFNVLIQSHVREELSISHDELIDIANATDQDISTLVSSGFLTIQSSTTYYFSVRNIGSFWSHFHKSRNELLSILKRAKFQEMQERLLLERKLRYGGGLSAKLVVMELLGSGVVASVETPVGCVIRIIKRLDAESVREVLRW